MMIINKSLSVGVSETKVFMTAQIVTPVLQTGPGNQKKDLQNSKTPVNVIFQGGHLVSLNSLHNSGEELE